MNRPTCDRHRHNGVADHEQAEVVAAARHPNSSSSNNNPYHNKTTHRNSKACHRHSSSSSNNNSTGTWEGSHLHQVAAVVAAAPVFKLWA